jgi:predicted DNA-binding transcriptional regulator AlpA
VCDKDADMQAEGLRLIDREQVARALGVRRQQLGEVTSDRGFPPAVGYYRGRWVWDARAVEAFMERTATGVELRQPVRM